MIPFPNLSILNCAPLKRAERKVFTPPESLLGKRESDFPHIGFVSLSRVFYLHAGH